MSPKTTPKAPRLSPRLARVEEADDAGAVLMRRKKISPDCRRAGVNGSQGLARAGVDARKQVRSFTLP